MKRQYSIFGRGFLMNAELEEFKTEMLEMLERAEHALLELDQLEENTPSFEHYDEVFRAFHNIKGAAGMMEWEELQHHIHKLENTLMQCKSTAIIPKPLISWFLKGIDATRNIIAGEPYEFNYEVQPVSYIEESKVDEDSLVEEQTTTLRTSEQKKSSAHDEFPAEFFSEVGERLENISSTLIKMESEGGNKPNFDSLHREIHSLKGAVALFGLAEATTLAHFIETSLERNIATQQFVLEPAHVNTILLCVDLFNECIHDPNSESVKSEVNFMKGLLAPFCENEVDYKESAPVATKPLEVVSHHQEKEHKTTTPAAASQETEKADTTIRVQVSLLDRLMTLMGEMVLVRNQVLQYSNKSDDPTFLNLSKKLDVVTSELQEETMKTRMQPIGNILNKFQRVVRDLSGTLNKKINLNLIGVETELDKTLIEAVKDPLTHIVRNACDHGIETPEARANSGKTEAGTITIKAYHEGGQVIVDISDDGKGLAREKLLTKAIEKGIIDKNNADRMSDHEVHALIFAPGFSTAEKVTNVSGRGVGMDVVKSNIEKIGGLVEISSVEGEGTKITLKIPLTLAIVPAMIVRTEQDRFAIPQVKLVELVRIERTAIEYVQGRPMYRLRGNILPLIDLKEVLGNTSKEVLDEALNIVVLNSEGLLFGMIVDEILDTADIVVKPLARFLKSVSIYSGATVLGDGSVAFILDVMGIALKHLGANSHSDAKKLADKNNLTNFDELELREFVLVKLGSQTKHAIPLNCVHRMEEVKTSSIEFSGYQKVIRYRGGILKIVNLNEIMGYPDSNKDREITQLIVAKVQDQLIGIEVDQIIDVLSTRDFLDQTHSSHEAITGNLVTSNEIIVVLDVDRVFELTMVGHVTKKVPTTAKKILFVEDTEAIRNKVSQSLRENGFAVEVATDGIDGLRKIAEHKFDFDLIISDIEMPKMNGFEFARKIRKIGQLKETPIIAFTTKNEEYDIRQAKDAGFSTFLEKTKGKLLPLLVSECLLGNKRKAA